MSDEARMSEQANEAAALARAFRVHLAHLRDFSGLHYVGAGPTPRSSLVIEDTNATEVAGAADADDVAAAAEAEVTVVAPTAAVAGGGVDDRAAADARWQQRARAGEASVLAAADAGRSVGTTPKRSASPAQTTHIEPPQQSQQFVPAAADHAHSRATQTQTPTTSPAPAQAQAWPAAKKLAYLRERNVGDCRRCPLSRTRRNIVFGVGNPEAEVMFVGEAPGGEEDRLGEPFVGPAGRRLDLWLGQVGLRRGDVYIANVLKCRPPNNRDPQPAEIERCSPFLHAQIRAIAPKVLIALGRFAGCLLIGEDRKLHEMRGSVQRYREPKSGIELPVVVTYHPSYVLRKDKERRQPVDPRQQTDRPGWINPEDQKVLTDIDRAVSLLRRP